MEKDGSLSRFLWWRKLGTMFRDRGGDGNLQDCGGESWESFEIAVYVVGKQSTLIVLVRALGSKNGFVTRKISQFFF